MTEFEWHSHTDTATIIENENKNGSAHGVTREDIEREREERKKRKAEGKKEAWEKKAAKLVLTQEQEAQKEAQWKKWREEWEQMYYKKDGEAWRVKDNSWDDVRVAKMMDWGHEDDWILPLHRQLQPRQVYLKDGMSYPNIEVVPHNVASQWK